MPTHYASRKLRIASVSTPVGNTIPHAVALAWAAKIRKGPEAVMVFFGDGATSSDGFHAGMNIAGVHRLPVVFVCRNNQYAISLPLSLQTASKTIAIKAQAYGFEGVCVDGQDAMAVYSATQEALERARAGEGPTLIDAVSYRLGCHTTSDDARRYRSDEEVRGWRNRDCIEHLRRGLERDWSWSEQQDSLMRGELDREIDQAVEAALSVPSPPVQTLFEDVYAEPPRHLREQRDALLKHRLKRGNTP